jgi:hypothetical protein
MVQERSNKEKIMVSAEYDEYKSYLEGVSDDELYLESEDTFAQISDSDESIKYALCVAEQKRRDRHLGVYA